jgi:hypothetical protein
MGLAVVGRIAGRHGMIVRLDRRTPHGTIASVLLRTGLLSDLPEAAWSGTQTVAFPRLGGSPTAAAPQGKAAGAGSPAEGRDSVPQNGTTLTGLSIRNSSLSTAAKVTPAPPPRSVVGGGHYAGWTGAASFA